MEAAIGKQNGVKNMARETITTEGNGKKVTLIVGHSMQTNCVDTNDKEVATWQHAVKTQLHAYGTRLLEQS